MRARLLLSLRTPRGSAHGDRHNACRTDVSGACPNYGVWRYRGGIHVALRDARPHCAMRSGSARHQDWGGYARASPGGCGAMGGTSSARLERARPNRRLPPIVTGSVQRTAEEFSGPHVDIEKGACRPALSVRAPLARPCRTEGSPYEKTSAKAGSAGRSPDRRPRSDCLTNADR